ncbi:MAG: hypothetical protein OK454_11010 [Thaumarchaeota archaeon]|nr:hypothetical protein [Nitrososphaerota archaeon]
MAATDKAAVASGADVGDAARRRNVPAAGQPAPAGQVEVDDKKKAAKKVCPAVYTPTLGPKARSSTWS